MDIIVFTPFVFEGLERSSTWTSPKGWNICIFPRFEKFFFAGSGDSTASDGGVHGTALRTCHTRTLFRVKLFTLRGLHCFVLFFKRVILIGTIHVAHAMCMALTAVLFFSAQHSELVLTSERECPCNSQQGVLRLVVLPNTAQSQETPLLCHGELGPVEQSKTICNHFVHCVTVCVVPAVSCPIGLNLFCEQCSKVRVSSGKGHSASSHTSVKDRHGHFCEQKLLAGERQNSCALVASSKKNMLLSLSRRKHDHHSMVVIHSLTQIVNSFAEWVATSISCIFHHERIVHLENCFLHLISQNQNSEHFVKNDNTTTWRLTPNSHLSVLIFRRSLILHSHQGC